MDPRVNKNTNKLADITWKWSRSSPFVTYVTKYPKNDANTHINTHICTYIYIYIHMYSHTHTHTHTRTHKYMYIHIYILEC